MNGCNLQRAHGESLRNAGRKSPCCRTLCSRCCRSCKSLSVCVRACSQFCTLNAKGPLASPRLLFSRTCAFRWAGIVRPGRGLGGPRSAARRSWLFGFGFGWHKFYVPRRFNTRSELIRRGTAPQNLLHVRPAHWSKAGVIRVNVPPPCADCSRSNSLLAHSDHTTRLRSRG